MFNLKSNEALLALDLPEDMRERLRTLLAAMHLAQTPDCTRLPEWLPNRQVVCGQFTPNHFLNETFHLRQVMGANSDDERRRLVAEQIARRGSFVVSVLHQINIQRRNHEIFVALASELKAVRKLIEDANLSSNHALVSFAIGLAVTLRALDFSGWSQVQTFNELIAKAEGLSVKRALESIHLLYEKVNNGNIVFTSYAYDFPHVPIDSDKEHLLEFVSAIEEAGEIAQQYSAAKQWLLYAKKDSNREGFASELEAAVEGRRTAQSRNDRETPSIEQVIGLINTREAILHASIGNLKMWHDMMLRSRTRLEKAVQAAVAAVQMPSLDNFSVHHAFSTRNQAATYQTMINCIVAKIMLAKIDVQMKDFDDRPAQLLNVARNPVEMIDSVLSTTAV